MPMPFFNRFNFFNPPPEPEFQRNRYRDINSMGPSESEIPQPDSVPGPFDERNRQDDVEGPITKKYREILSTDPSARGDYKPSVGRRFGAIGMGALAGPYAGFEFLNRPERTESNERDERVNELSKGAKLEFDQSKENWNRFNDTERNRILDKNANTRATNTASLVERRGDLTDIQRYKAKNPGYTWRAIPGGNVVGFHKSDPTKIVDTGISSGRLSDEDKLTLAQENDLDKITARGDQGVRVENAKQGNREKQAEVDNNFKVMLEDLKNKHSKEKKSYGVLTPKGGKVTFYNKQDPTDVVTSNIDTGTLTDEQREQLKNYETTSTTSVDATDKAGNPTKVTRKTTRTKPDVTNKFTPAGGSTTKPKQMTGPDGQKYDTSTWSDKDIEEAKKRGYK